MSINTFRFVVENDDGERSQEWRVWAQGNEVYVGARSTAHEYKASFHSSGQCHVGISSTLRQTLVGDSTWAGKSRLFSKWNLEERDTQLPRYDLLEILIPNAYLDLIERGRPSAGDILRSLDGHITSVTLVKARLSSGFCVTSNEQNFEELHRIELKDGHSIVILKRLLTESPAYHTYVRCRFWSHFLAERTPDGRTYGVKDFDTSSPNIRAMLWDGSGSRKYWHEVSARKLFTLGPPVQ